MPQSGEADTKAAIVEAKSRLSPLLAELARRAEVTVTKRGVPVAKLVPVTPGFDHEKAQRVVAGLREASWSNKLRGLKTKDLMDERRP
jgi:prevent-host-death family protein